MKIALVTGCSSGIGLATAIKLAREGMKTYATMRNPAKAGELIEAATQAGVELEIPALEVTDQNSVDQCIGSILEANGQIDVLVNNAGVGGSGPFEMVPIEDHYRTFETNYFGAVRMMKAVLPGMRERTSGAIINITSMEGRLAFFNQTAYTASKFALEASTEALAYEVASYNIRVAAVEPGVIMTRIFENSEKQGGNYFDRDWPYYQVMRRNAKIFKHGFMNPTYPDAVADTIWNAITTDQPKLRYPVGEDAFKLTEGRSKMSDEDYIALGQDMTDEEYAARFNELFGIELP